MKHKLTVMALDGNEPWQDMSKKAQAPFSIYGLYQTAAPAPSIVARYFPCLSHARQVTCPTSYLLVSHINFDMPSMR